MTTATDEQRDLSPKQMEVMSAWQLRDYGGIGSLELVKDLPVPKITSYKDVLVEVRAASVNVLDAWMPGMI